MKKGLSVAVVALICLGMSEGCGAQNGGIPDVSKPVLVTESTNTDSPTTTPNYADAYNKLNSFKADGYESERVATFNHSLTPDNGDLTEILEHYAEVAGFIPEEDENYDFLHVTLAASLNELYCERLGGEISFFGYVKKLAHPVEPLNEEEKQILDSKELYDFIFSAFYTVHYAITDPALTIGERDSALRTFYQELQTYVDGLSEAEIMTSNIGDKLTQKAEEIAERLCSEKIELTSETSNIEISYNGTEIQK